MAEVNLGEALSYGTALPPDSGMPITKGLQLNEQAGFRDMQLQMKREAEALREQERARKLLTVNSGKWHNPKYAKEFEDYYSSVIPEMRKADPVTQAKYEMGVKTKLATLKAQDETENEIFSSKAGSVTRPIAQKIYRTSGIDGISEYNQRYSFAPIAQVDPESGYIKVVDVRTENPNKIIDEAIDKVFVQKYKNTGNRVGSTPIYVVDKNDKTYIDNVNQAKKNLLTDARLQDAILYSEEFRNYFDKEVEKIGEDAGLLSSDKNFMTDLYSRFVDEKFNSRNRDKVKFGGTPSSKGNNNNNSFGGGSFTIGGFTFTPNNDDGFITGTKSTGNAPIPISGKKIIEGKVDANTNEKVFSLVNPKIKYLGNDSWIVSGSQTSGGLPLDLSVSTPTIRSVFSLQKDSDLAKFGWKPKAKAQKLNKVDNPLIKASSR